MVAALLLVALALVVFSMYWIVHEKRKFPPGPFALPILGNLPAVIRNSERWYEWQEENRAKYGPVFQVTLPKIFGMPNIIFAADAKSCHYFLTEKFENFVKGPRLQQVLFPLLGEGIFNVDGWKWEKQRKIASYMFSQNYLKYMTEAFKEHASELVTVFDKYAASGEVMDTGPIFSAYTMDSFVEIAFGEKISSLTAEGENEFAKAFNNAVFYTDRRSLTPMWQYLPFLPVNRKLMQEIKTVNKYVADIIKRRRAANTENKREDLISFFLRLKDENVDPTDEFLRDLVTNFLLAGRDTTAATLSWLFYELARTPRVEQKLRAEVTSTFPKNEAPDFETLKKLPYLKACMDETLRLYPPVPFDVKTPTDSDQLLPNGAVVKFGDHVNWSAWLLGRDPEVYDCPTEFRPERWLGENGTKPQPVPQQGNAIPFQTGPRTCLGMNMAYMEVKLVVVTLFQRYKFSLPEGFQAKWRRQITIGIEGQMKLLATRLSQK